ncbi:MAG: MaoC family dehydratase, partial [Actinobacteria bacterium]|nr:MaoC family dehydratase [Actinomycetota bacterium]
MVNPNVQGKKYPATNPYLVGREKIREFAHAVKSTNPINLDVFA